MALETLVLRLKSLGIKDILKFPYLTSPDKEGLVQSIRIMKYLGCLDHET